jgi:hypothetical protein
MVSNDVVFNIDVRYVDGSEDRFRCESQMGSNGLYGLARRVLGTQGRCAATDLFSTTLADEHRRRRSTVDSVCLMALGAYRTRAGKMRSSRRNDAVYVGFGLAAVINCPRP